MKLWHVPLNIDKLHFLDDRMKDGQHPIKRYMHPFKTKGKISLVKLFNTGFHFYKLKPLAPHTESQVPSTNKYKESAFLDLHL